MDEVEAVASRAPYMTGMGNHVRMDLSLIHSKELKIENQKKTNMD